MTLSVWSSSCTGASPFDPGTVGASSVDTGGRKRQESCPYIQKNNVVIDYAWQ